ncbi:MAG: GNAT family N-acetyltransferase [Butyrivibrio sp.]|nr:GNAT family N-acetyltransferase [Acetatifactor muris]MCM1558506.1 GNAT family N-acetyltransferase [Butyrivibrio sp.]
MYGAFADGRLTGFIGTHAAGGMGMLYVEEAYRGLGLGKSLVSYQINRTLEQGRIPYCHVPEDSPAAEGILEKLGLYRAGKTVWWLEG